MTAYDVMKMCSPRTFNGLLKKIIKWIETSQIIFNYDKVQNRTDSSRHLFCPLSINGNQFMISCHYFKLWRLKLFQQEYLNSTLGKWRDKEKE